MNTSTIIAIGSCLLTVCLIVGLLFGCVQKAPAELLESVEALDQELTQIRAAEYAPEEYARFVRHWVAVKGRLLSEEEEIRWPWEPNPLAAELSALQEDGEQAVAVAEETREEERLDALQRLDWLERRLARFASHIEEIGGRVALERKPIETELLLRQGRSYYEQGLYARALDAVEQASRLVEDQATILTTALARYADDERVSAWRQMVRRTVQWSATHHAAAIVVTKADRRLTLYRDGRAVASYPIRLGYNGVLEKRYRGDGATPEGSYRIIEKRDLGETRYYRALVLDYPNAEDRRRYSVNRQAGSIPVGATIREQVEIHGVGDGLMTQTLGCIMLGNRQVDQLFEQVNIGTPVIIVGAVHVANKVALALAGLDEAPEEQNAEVPEETEEPVEQG